MILSKNGSTSAATRLAELFPFVKRDIKATLEAMEGLPSPSACSTAAARVRAQAADQAGRSGARPGHHGRGGGERA